MGSPGSDWCAWQAGNFSGNSYEKNFRNFLKIIFGSGFFPVQKTGPGKITDRIIVCWEKIQITQSIV
ncbi:MAG: hypothetical protein CVV30_03230 [Methanomicrobiales archaeon HGW-Methanomicrobiales-1]|nr:MAG: hypothetical protein CVV30_03230 [Methanomicrobiales archaeon HGW-Methanomicrobiales-1]